MSVNEKMTNIANAIREKTGETEKLTLDEMASEIATIESGIDTSDATAQIGEIFYGKTAYVDGQKITGNFTIDDEVADQISLISQIKSTLESKGYTVGGTT